MASDIPSTGFLRLPQVLELFPISKSAWWKGCASVPLDRLKSKAEIAASGTQPWRRKNGNHRRASQKYSTRTGPTPPRIHPCREQGTEHQADGIGTRPCAGEDEDARLRAAGDYRQAGRERHRGQTANAHEVPCRSPATKGRQKDKKADLRPPLLRS